MIVLQGISFERILGAYTFIDYKKHQRKMKKIIKITLTGRADLVHRYLLFFHFSRVFNSRGDLEIRMFIEFPVLCSYIDM